MDSCNVAGFVYLFKCRLSDFETYVIGLRYGFRVSVFTHDRTFKDGTMLAWFLAFFAFFSFDWLIILSIKCQKIVENRNNLQFPRAIVWSKMQTYPVYYLLEPMWVFFGFLFWKTIIFWGIIMPRHKGAVTWWWWVTQLSNRHRCV